jgi:hypothetical protein
MERAAIASYAIVGAVAAALGVTFWLVLDPVRTGGCNTSPLPGPYTDALVPAHLAAAVALGACALWLDRGRRTRIALAAVAVYVLASLVAPVVFAPAAIAGLVLGWPAGLFALVAAFLRRDRPRLAAQIVVWTALLLVLPGHFVAAWDRAADWFCF